jgi:hypothetical protein
VLRPGVLPRQAEHALCDSVGLHLGRTAGDRADARLLNGARSFSDGTDAVAP